MNASAETGVEGFDLEAALANVVEDPELQPLEKETAIHFSKDTDTARLTTAEAGLMRRVLAHPAAGIITLTVVDGDARPAVAPGQYDGETIVGVEAALPIGALNVRLHPRESNQHAKVVTQRVWNAAGVEL